MINSIIYYKKDEYINNKKPSLRIHADYEGSDHKLSIVQIVSKLICILLNRRTFYLLASFASCNSCCLEGQ